MSHPPLLIVIFKDIVLTTTVSPELTWVYSFLAVHFEEEQSSFFKIITLLAKNGEATGRKTKSLGFSTTFLVRFLILLSGISVPAINQYEGNMGKYSQ